MRKENAMYCMTLQLKTGSSQDMPQTCKHYLFEVVGEDGSKVDLHCFAHAHALRLHFLSVESKQTAHAFL